MKAMILKEHEIAVVNAYRAACAASGFAGVRAVITEQVLEFIQNGTKALGKHETQLKQRVVSGMKPNFEAAAAAIEAFIVRNSNSAGNGSTLHHQ